MSHYTKQVSIAEAKVETVADLLDFLKFHEGTADFDATYLRDFNTVRVLECTLEDGSKVYDLQVVEG